MDLNYSKESKSENNKAFKMGKRVNQA
jgi:large subunit ribosomal protein L23Ae